MHDALSSTTHTAAYLFNVLWLFWVNHWSTDRGSCVFMYVCVCECVYLCVCVCMCIYVCAQGREGGECACDHVRVRECIHEHISVRVNAHFLGLSTAHWAGLHTLLQRS
jgi:hypothetical protein